MFMSFKIYEQENDIDAGVTLMDLWCKTAKNTGTRIKQINF